jgi:hypothetical protein
MPKTAVSPHRIVLTAAYLALAAVWVLLALRGAEYYTTAWGLRARHPLYWDLKPGGNHGLLYGYVGTTMMSVLLLYSLRKRVRFLRHLGSLSKWLDWHIFLGVYGPLFIVLHSSLKVGGLVSISFWSMLTVALSGVFGRFLYLQIPRSRSGHALTLGQIEEARESLATALKELAPKAAERLPELDRVAAETVQRERSLIRLALGLPWQSWRLRRTIRRLLATWGLEPALRRRITGLAIAEANLHRRMLLLGRLQRLFHYWHVFHKPFAIIMYCLMVVHIAVAWMTGYRGLLG